MRCRRAQPSESREVSAWIAQSHYTRSAPPGYVWALEFLLGGERIGAMLVGRPSARVLDPDRWMELTRMYFVDETPLFVESRGLSLMRRQVRIWLPKIRALIAYADPSMGHQGTVYEADGWAQFGTTKAQHEGWRSRPNRRLPPDGSTYTSKARWIRTP